MDNVRQGSLVLDYPANRVALVVEGETLMTFVKPHISLVSAPSLSANRIVIHSDDGLTTRLYYGENGVPLNAEAAADFSRLQILLTGYFSISVLTRNSLYFVNTLTVAIRKAGLEVERLAVDNIVTLELSIDTIIITDVHGNTHVLVYDSALSATNDFELYHTMVLPGLPTETFEDMGDDSISVVTSDRLTYTNAFGNVVTTVSIPLLLEVFRVANDVVLVEKQTRVVVLRYSSDYYALTAYNNTLEAIAPLTE